MKQATGVLLALLLSACAATPDSRNVAPELFAVIPGTDGHVGSIVVTRGTETRVIDAAYAAQRIDPSGALVASRLSDSEVRQGFGDTLAALPGKPAKFTLYFLEGKDELTQDSKMELERVFSELKRRPLPDIVVIGHTDTVGTLPFNDRLSRQRADRLREMMVELGIAPDRIQAAGRGKRELLVPTEDNISEARNRRVEINVR